MADDDDLVHDNMRRQTKQFDWQKKQQREAEAIQIKTTK